MAGMWVAKTNDQEHPFSETKVAISRAMHVNGCSIGTSYDDAVLENFAIGGNQPDSTCQRIVGCAEQYPLVVCELQRDAQQSNDDVTEPGFSTFIKLFSKPPL